MSYLTHRGIGATADADITPVYTAGSVPHLPWPMWDQQWREQASRTSAARAKAKNQGVNPSTIKIFGALDQADSKLREARGSLDRHTSYFTHQNELYIKERLEAADQLTRGALHLLHMEKLAAAATDPADQPVMPGPAGSKTPDETYQPGKQTTGGNGVGKVVLWGAVAFGVAKVFRLI